MSGAWNSSDVVGRAGAVDGGPSTSSGAEVDVADEACLGGFGDVVLDQDTVLENTDLDAAETASYDHDPVDAFTTSEELGLGDDRATASGIPTVTTTLLLRFESG